MTAISMNSTALRPMRPKGKHSWISWAPFLVLIVAGGLAAAGFSVSQKAFGLGAPQNVTVQASVGPEMHFTGAMCAPGLTNLTAGAAAPENVGAACLVTYGSNIAQGVNVTIENAAAAGQFLCWGVAAARNCATGNYTDELPTGTATGSVTAGKAGVQLTVKSAGSTADMTAGATTVYGVPASGASIGVCHSLAAADQTCTIQFLAKTALSGQTSGQYEGKASIGLVSR